MRFIARAIMRSRAYDYIKAWLENGHVCPKGLAGYRCRGGEGECD